MEVNNTSPQKQNKVLPEMEASASDNQEGNSSVQEADAAAAPPESNHASAETRGEQLKRSIFELLGQVSPQTPNFRADMTDKEFEEKIKNKETEIAHVRSVISHTGDTLGFFQRFSDHLLEFGEKLQESLNQEQTMENYQQVMQDHQKAMERLNQAKSTQQKALQKQQAMEKLLLEAMQNDIQQGPCPPNEGAGKSSQ